VKWQNVRASKDELRKQAEAKVQNLPPGDFPTRVFLLGSLYSTDCQKDSRGGMQNSKQYWDIGHLGVDGAESLAQALSGKTCLRFVQLPMTNEHCPKGADLCLIYLQPMSKTFVTAPC
jgi:hypothetical protein